MGLLYSDSDRCLKVLLSEGGQASSAPTTQYFASAPTSILSRYRTQQQYQESMDDCSDESSKKVTEQQTEGHQNHHDYGGFASLPTDVLISILCRSPASDHLSLRDTCKSFRTTIDSSAYKGERATSGWGGGIDTSCIRQ
eukprot:scaffold2987_cov77-Skeletonema_dohrnii-CCMP3373.AAC.7